MVRILSRPSRAAGPWEGRLTSGPGRGGSGRGSEEPASASATATCSRPPQGPAGSTLSHPELERPQKRHTLPQSQKTSQEQPASGSLQPGTDHVRPAPRVRAPPLGRSRRAPGHLATAAAVRRRPGGPGFLSWSRPLLLLFPPRALPAASPCPPAPPIGLGRDYMLGARAVGPVSATLRLNPKPLTA